MNIEMRSSLNLRTKTSIGVLAGELFTEFGKFGLLLEGGPQTGGLTTRKFNFYVEDMRAGAHLGALRITFNPEGWTLHAPQNEHGMHMLAVFGRIIGREIAFTDLSVIRATRTDIAQYGIDIPFERAERA